MNAESEKSVNQLRKIMDEGDELRKFIRPKEAIRIYSLSRTFIEEIAKKSGAMYKIGKVVLINVKVSLHNGIFRKHERANDSFCCLPFSLRASGLTVVKGQS